MKFTPVLLTIVFSLFSTLASADMPASGKPQGPGIMFRQGGIGTMGSFSVDRPSVGIAFIPVDHMQIGVNVGLTYDGNNILVDPNSSPYSGARMPGSKWRSDLLIALEYMVHDVYPFAMGPQLAVATNLAPGAVFDHVAIMPAFGFWYAPFNANVGIGSSLGVNIMFGRNSQPVVQLSTPAVRLVYVFN